MSRDQVTGNMLLAAVLPQQAKRRSGTPGKKPPAPSVRRLAPDTKAQIAGEKRLGADPEVISP
jgi:hypothetical protein